MIKTLTRIGAVAGLLLVAVTWEVSAQTVGLSAVDAQIHTVASNERTTLDRTTGELISTVDIALFNLGGRTMTTPLHLVVNLDVEGTNLVTMPGALGGRGVGPYGTYYQDMDGAFPEGRILPNAEARTTLTFVHDRDTRFRYTPVPHATLEEVGPPVLETPATAFEVREGETLTVVVSASDPDDGEVVSLSAGPLLSNAVFTATAGVTATGTLVFLPDFDQAGIYPVTFTATDELGLTDQATVMITVQDVNRAPTLSGPAEATVTEGGFLTLPFTAADPDGDVVRVTGQGLPPGAVLVEETATLYYAPVEDAAGEYLMELEASDGDLSSASHAFALTVLPGRRGGPGDESGLTLVVDPMPSPSLLAVQRVRGMVNQTGAVERIGATMALITGLAPAQIEQGQTREVILTGMDAGDFATHFGEESVASFGPGVAVRSLTVNHAALAVATIAAAPDAAPGPRGVIVTTGNESAVSLVAMNVVAGAFELTGSLVDTAGSNALAGALVTLQGTGYSTVTGADGSFSFNGLPPGDYTLIINPPDHAPVTMPVSAVAGQSLVLDPIPTAATVFDPAAPASVSLLSVLGRGLVEFDGVRDLAKLRRTIQDALLLTGGTEAGVLDEFGNQLNPELSGPGLVSILPVGIELLADRTDRGETVSLLETILPFTFGFAWTNGPPPTLKDWIDGLQEQVNAAWAAPSDPANQLPLLVFNRGRTLLPEPPKLTPETRLSPAQNYLFVVSMLAHAVSATNGPGILAVPLTRRDALPAVTADSSGGRKFTSYWRGFNNTRNNFFALQMNAAFTGFNNMCMFMTIAGSGGVRTLLPSLPIIGLLQTQIVGAFANIGMSMRVPEPPRMVGIKLVPGAGEVPVVKVTVRRSPSDLPGERVIYSLYRFRNFNEGRQLVGLQASAAAVDNLLTLTDLDPYFGSTFYAVTLTKIFDADTTLTPAVLNELTPWFNFAVHGMNDPAFAFAASRQRLASDYSEPAIINVVGSAGLIEVNAIEINPLTGTIYYSDPSGTTAEKKILRFDDMGEGDLSILAYTGFKDPGHEGLAIDNAGDLYSINKASDAMFGGRVFRFDGETGARTHVGSINYYSRDLQFANPVDSFTATMGPSGQAPAPIQDLYTVDMLAGQIKRVPVQATYDPFRRVGQPFANLPVSGRPIDLQVKASGAAYLLMADMQNRDRFTDREKGTMHLPPGAPLKQVKCPELGEKLADPVYPFSGEFYETVQDLWIPGRGVDFRWVRKYRSKIGVDTIQGKNWDYSYNIYIEEDGFGNIIVYDGHTRADTYLQSGTNNLWTLPEFFRELHRNPDGTWELVFEDQGRWVFRALDGTIGSGRVTESTDRYGNRLAFAYDAQGRLDVVTDTLGRHYTLAYNAEGYLDTLTDFTGRAIRYEYYGAGDPDGNPGDLKAVITPAVTLTPNGNDFPNGKRVSYTYSTGFADPRLNGNLLTITDGRRNDPNDPTFGSGPYVSNTYAATTNSNDLLYDRVVSQTWGNPGDTLMFHWVRVAATLENGGAVVKLIVNDREGHVKESFFNEANQCTRMREYTGRAIRGVTTTETANRPVGKLRETDPDYFETQYVWNADSLKTREVHPNGNITEWTYESDYDADAPARTRANVRRIRHFPGTHSITGDQAMIEEHFEYDTSHGMGCCGFNFVTRHIDGMGQETLKFYDPFGNMTSVVHRIPSIREDYVYDAYGRMTHMVHPDNGSGYRRVDAFVFYGPGDGAQNGYMKQTIVDEGGLNLTTTYQYNPIGRVTRATDPGGNSTDYLLNQRGMVMRETKPEVTPGSGIRYQEDFWFDANDNVVRVDRQNVDENGVVQPNSHFTTTYAYDILDYLTRQYSEIDAQRGQVTEYLYDRNRNRVATRYGEAVNGRQSTNVLREDVDERDKLYRRVRAPGDAAQSSVQFDYDGNGNLVRTTFGLEGTPAVFTATYDGFDRKVSETDPFGNQVVLHYNPNNLPILSQKWGELVDLPGGASNVLLAETHYDLDRMQRITNKVESLFDPVTQLPIGNGARVKAFVYSGKSARVREVDDNGHEVRMFYDAANRPVTRVDSLSNTVTRVFDANGNVLQIVETERSDLGGTETFTTTYTYDGLDRLIQTRDSGGQTRSVHYDSLDNPVLMVDGRGNRERFTYDGLRRLLQQTIAMTSDGTGDGIVITNLVLGQTWDDSSRLTSMTDDAGNVTTYEYDSLDRPVAVIMADGTETRTTYDVHDNAVLEVDAQGTRVTMQYDALDRLTRRDVAPGPGVATTTTFEQFAYDGLSRMIRAENNASVVTRAFDSASRVMAETLNGQTVRHTFDGVGNWLTSVYPGGRSITNTYDARDRLKTVSDDAGLVGAYAYAGPGRVARRTLGNTTTTTISYDTTRRVARTTHVRDPGGTPVTLDDRAYGWDAAHNKTLRTDILAVTTNRHLYDSANRLVTTDRFGPPTVTYALDGVGNRKTVSGGTQPGSYIMSADTPEPADAQMNQYTLTPASAQAYDTNGNLVVVNAGQPSERRLAFDYRNRLTEFRVPSTGLVVAFAYDSFGRRILKTENLPTPQSTRYFYDGDRVIEERDAGNTVIATYVYGNDIDERLSMTRLGLRYFYHGDDQFNVVKVSDASGAVVEQYAYDDFGAPTIRNGMGMLLGQSGIGNAYLYSGREFDQATGFYNFRTRYMDPTTGRFISRDTIGAWGDPVNMGNAFTYAGNNPWSRRDPYGNVSGLEAAQFTGGVVVGGGESLVNIALGLLHAAGVGADFAANPIGTSAQMTSAAMALIDEIMRDPNGPSAALTRKMFPEIWEDIVCLDHLTPFEKGRLTGRIAGEVIPAVIGIAQGVKAASMATRASRVSTMGKGSKGADIGESTAKSGPSGKCFVAGTPIATAEGSRPIETLRVGDRVLTTDGDDPATVVDPATWRVVRLSMPNLSAPSDVYDIEMLCPETWLIVNGAEVGLTVELAFEELDLHGRATVLAIGPCPPLTGGPGRLVLSTIAHLNAEVVQVRLQGESAPLGITGPHRLFSVTRDAWVPAAELEPGEYLMTREGTVRVESVYPKPGIHRVYNIEVETVHSYYAGASRVLSHNAHKCGGDGKGADEGGKTGPERRYEGADYHGETKTGAKNPAPKNGQQGLDDSVQIKDTSPRRIAVDKESGEFNIFDQTREGIFHGHSRSWDELDQGMRNKLIKEGVVNRKGKIL